MNVDFFLMAKKAPPFLLSPSSPPLPPPPLPIRPPPPPHPLPPAPPPPHLPPPFLQLPAPTRPLSPAKEVRGILFNLEREKRRKNGANNSFKKTGRG